MEKQKAVALTQQLHWEPAQTRTSSPPAFFMADHANQGLNIGYEQFQALLFQGKQIRRPHLTMQMLSRKGSHGRSCGCSSSDQQQHAAAMDAEPFEWVEHATLQVDDADDPSSSSSVKVVVL